LPSEKKKASAAGAQGKKKRRILTKVFTDVKFGALVS
jgi:hypothetical protein